MPVPFSRARRAQLLLCLAAGFCPCACAPTPGTPDWGRGPIAGQDPFAATSLRIFPLTRLDVDADGKPMIVCHIEFRDAWGDSVKAAGLLQVNMSGSIGPSGGRQEIAPLSWDIDLADLKRNSALYDRATRTYRIQLVDLPPALVAPDPAAPSDTSTPWRIILRATLSSPAGGPPLMQDEYSLQP